jgi:hypothetical protein
MTDYKWHTGATQCEVCKTIGRTQQEQSTIRKDGICWKCAPINRHEDSRLRDVGRPGGSAPSVGKKKLPIQSFGSD